MKRLCTCALLWGLGLSPRTGAATPPPVQTPASAFSHSGPLIDLAHTHWADAAAKRALDPYLLYAVALVESARIADGRATPWPWALNHSGRTHYPPSPAAALAQVRARLAAGQRLIDVGLMQVNLRWHGRRVNGLDALLDPVTNVDLGAEILAEAIASAPGDLALGVGRYHAWQDRPAAYRYGRRVLALAARLRAP
jgi:soluble lytic murein transglycosylase-like protein